MKYILNAVCVAIALSACTALPNGEYAAASDVATASDVVSASEPVSGSQSASDVAQAVEPPTTKVATEKTNPKSTETQTTENDITVLPVATPKTDSDKVAKNTTKNNKNDTNVKLNVTLRNQPKTETTKKTKTTKITQTTKTTKSTAKTVKMVKPVVKLPPPPPPKPVLTRRQVLEQEIARERAALQSAKAQLAAAKKSGNAKNIAKLNAAVQDRELNVRAIESEMKR